MEKNISIEKLTLTAHDAIVKEKIPTLPLQRNPPPRMVAPNLRTTDDKNPIAMNETAPQSDTTWLAINLPPQPSPNSGVTPLTEAEKRKRMIIAFGATLGAILVLIIVLQLTKKG